VLNDVIENVQDFVASVTLSKKRKNHGLGHNKEGKCRERVLGISIFNDPSFPLGQCNLSSDQFFIILEELTHLIII
jgi:hypothetical protein